MNEQLVKLLLEVEESFLSLHRTFRSDDWKQAAQDANDLASSADRLCTCLLEATS